MNNAENLKRMLPDVLAILLFVALSFAYFFPADIEGRILYRHDSSAGVGAGQEQLAYKARTGEMTRWTNSLFSGMPTYQLAPSYKSTDVVSKVADVYHLWLPENVWFLFAYLLGFYILLRAFDFRQHLAVLGALTWAFSTYFLIIIAAGHIWKVWALAYLPPLIGGIVLAYRGKYLWGLAVTALFSALEVQANHVQMTYYYLFVIAFMLFAYLIDAIRNKQMGHFLRATGVVVIGAAIGILVNISNLYHTWQYSQESMRGKSELRKADSKNQTSSGLERDYITQWSYGIGETWTLLVPNTKGGASAPLASNATAMSKAKTDFVPVYQQMSQYWGEQPGTSGPVYVGAFVVLLFILGLFIVKGPMKWALLAATILSIMLSWGKNFMGLTDFFLDYFPMYAKFRTVASILVIAEFTIPLLGILAMREWMNRQDKASSQYGSSWGDKYGLYVAYGLTGGICLLFALFPGLFFSSFISSSEAAALSSLPAQYIDPIKDNLTEMRQAVFRADAWRSFIVITVGMGLLMLMKWKKLSERTTVTLLIALCLFDLWQVNKRYLNDAMFVPAAEREMAQPKTATDEFLLQDKDPNFRVLNLATNTFNENTTSYYHKSIGGYHAAKLRRYQELIEAYISPEMNSLFGQVANAAGDMTKVNGDSIFPVLNMLNAKYFIFPLQTGQTVPLQNPYSFGNAWFVDHVEYIDNANDELDALGRLNLRHEAVSDKKFEQTLGQSERQDSISQVVLDKYEPNELTYTIESSNGGVVVFSEIYYPGWVATVDGRETELCRADYVLRAIRVEAGKHQVSLTFKPKSVTVTESIAYGALGILFLLILFIAYKTIRKNLVTRS